MPDFIFRANVDRYLELLNDLDLAPEKRAMINKLLIEEEDKLSHDQECLQFAESRAAQGRELLDRARSRLKSDDLTGHSQAVRLVANLESIQHLLNHFCHQFRAKVNSRL
jgi:hypothetical protein